MELDAKRGGDDAGVRAFLDREFDGAPGVCDEFPALTAPSNAGRRFVIEAEARIVAHAAWRPLTLRSSLGRLPVAGIGLVTTHRGWRGRGLGSRVVGACVRDAEREGAWVALLFAAARSLYAKLGFVPAGVERITRLRPGSRDAPVRCGTPKDASRLLRLLDAHPVGVERSVEEFEAQLRVRDTHLYVLEEADGIAAYCIEGRGRDLRGVVHEWAGRPDALAGLLGALAARPDGPGWLLSPGALPAPVAGEHHRGAMAQMRVLRPEELGTADAAEAFGGAEREARIPVYVWGLDSV